MNASQYDDEIDDALRAAASSGKVHAIGGCGLSLQDQAGETGESSSDDRLLSFRRQIAIARDFDLPLVVQANGAHQAALNLLHEEGFPLECTMVRAFDGSDDELTAWAGAGAFVSFGGWSADDPLKLNRQVKLMPVDRVLVESGAPEETIDKLAGFPARMDQVVFVADALISLVPADQLMSNAESFYRASVNA